MANTRPSRCPQNRLHVLLSAEAVASLCKRRGFIFQSGEIYGGLNGCWDYGPLGVELKRNLKDYWWRRNVIERADVVLAPPDEDDPATTGAP